MEKSGKKLYHISHDVENFLRYVEYGNKHNHIAQTVATHTQRMSVTVSASGFEPEGNGSTPLCAALRCNYAKTGVFFQLN